EAQSGYYAALFGDAKAFPEASAPYADDGRDPVSLRDAYAIARNTVADPDRQAKMNAFFWWATWACATERPAEGALMEGPATPLVSYTNNWPAERLINNEPSGEIVVWSVLSFVFLLAGIGA